MMTPQKSIRAMSHLHTLIKAYCSFVNHRITAQWKPRKKTVITHPFIRIDIARTMRLQHPRVHTLLPLNADRSYRPKILIPVLDQL